MLFSSQPFIHTDKDVPDKSVCFLFVFFFSSGTDVPEGLFMATTSSIVDFVEDFNQFFKCPSNNGKCKGMFYIFTSLFL